MQIGLSASTYPGDDFDLPIPHALLELLQIPFTLDFHGISLIPKGVERQLTANFCTNWQKFAINPKA